jgi:hypothetical protein
MLWYCRFRWHDNTRAEDVRRRVLEQHEKGTNKPDKIRGWFNLVGGGAGFLLVEADSSQEVTDILQPYMDLVSWDVHGIYELPYNRAIEGFRKELQMSV